MEKIELTEKDKLLEEKEAIIKEKEAVIEKLKLKTKPRSLGFYRSRFNAWNKP